MHDFQWTNPFGEKLARRFAMLKVKVLRTQQHLIPDLVDLVYTTPICKSFLSLLIGNQTFACKAKSRRLQTLNESSRGRVHRLNNITHWRPRVEAISQLKRRCTDGLIVRCIMSNLCMHVTTEYPNHLVQQRQNVAGTF